MGMYDYVKLAVPCPRCGAIVAERPQTKDGECALEAVAVERVKRMICHCRVCGIYFTIRVLQPVHARVEATEDHWDNEKERYVVDFQRSGHLEHVRDADGGGGAWVLTWHDEQDE